MLKIVFSNNVPNTLPYPVPLCGVFGFFFLSFWDFSFFIELLKVLWKCLRNTHEAGSRMNQVNSKQKSRTFETTANCIKIGQWP